MKTLLVTGSSGLVGSACVRYFASLGWEVHGADSNLRRTFFGPDGDTTPALTALQRDVPDFVHHELDIRDLIGISDLFAAICPGLIVHAAAQPSHDWAAKDPRTDFDVNAVGTLNLLMAARHFCPDSPFVFLSTNKVYGDAPNELPLIERVSRFDLANPADRHGINESMRIDASMHSLFGVSKTAADLLVQEYGRYFGMPTVSFRCGCLTGSAHAGTEQHGFLAYLARCCREGRTYRIYGHKGKQVRDNLHAFDVARACEEYANAPRPGEVYNLGGGWENAVSVREAIQAVQEATGRQLSHVYEPEARRGDHICYYSDTRKFRGHYPGWTVTRGLGAIVEELCAH